MRDGMVDREKVIKGLEYCTGFDGNYCDVSPYSLNEFECNREELKADALVLLKAQEPPTDVSISSAIECLLHPQDADDSDMAKAIDTAVRAMRLLKEQEPVEPFLDYDGNDVWRCGNCHRNIFHPSHTDADEDEKNYRRFCFHCGRAVRWT